ncbi:hypothetical protein, partial [Aeromonas veronii]|uniref:hypothetical protein n=1 Tax=Aeromonas veronii TaxID=654 RepID=UPI003006C4BF
MEAWLEVESASVAVASSFWGRSPDEEFKNMPRLGEYLLQCKVIDEKLLSVFNKLRQLRNKAAHAQELDLSECSGQLNPDTWLGRTSAFAGGIPSL